MRRDVGSYNSALLYGRPEKDLSVQGLQPNGVSYANYGAAEVRRTFNSSRLRTDDLGRGGLASANNKKSSRSNQARLGGRIPDIYGKVLSVPDLITKPYVSYSGSAPNQQAYETSYLCVGRGDLSVTNTSVLSHAGNPTVTIYSPNTTISGMVAPSGESPIEEITLVKAPGDGVYTTSSSTLGPFYFDGCQGVIVNMVGSGLLSGLTWISGNVTVSVSVAKLNDAGQAVASQSFSFSINALAAWDFQTRVFNTSFSGRLRCYVTRTQSWGSSENSIGHKRMWLTGIYGQSTIGSGNFGDVTLMKVRVENESADISGLTTNDRPTIKKEKSLRVTCQAERNITGTNTAFSDIAKAVSFDTKIGNKSASEVDTTQLADLQTEIETYFGTSKAAEFNHTFDDIDTSFEETINTICRAAFVEVYRQGPVIKFKFEQPTTTPKLLFNHRNKIPGTESRTINFGYLNEKNGVSFQYKTLDDTAQLDFELPGDGTEINIETDGPVGITNKLQAYFHAHRQWNKQKYQNTFVEFQATQEAELLLIKDLILVSNNTRPNTWDGEVVSKNNLVLTLSQPYTGSNNATIFIQSFVSGVFATSGITKVSGNPYQITLNSDPQASFSFNNEEQVKPLYEIVENASIRKDLFLVSEVDINDRLTASVVAGNYDSRYYGNDKDYINEVVDINGELL